ncbi:MAG: hypothetical protein ABIJ34_07880 [archaeon]
MVLPLIADAMEKRRTELIEMLENSRDSLELEKQHQLYGAINEIDLFLRTINYYQTNSIEGSSAVNLVRPPEKVNFFGKIFQGFKGKVPKNSE